MASFEYCIFLALIACVTFNPASLATASCTATSCLDGYRCVVVGRRTICVPLTSKPGSCPLDPSVGICVVLCDGDESCPGRKKCCGSCPRKCTNPVW